MSARLFLIAVVLSTFPCAASAQIAKIETGYIPGPKSMTFMYEGSARPG